MELPEQPPPGPDHLEELPPEGWRGISPQAFWMWVVGGVVAVVLFLSWLSSPVILRSAIAAERTEAISNAKQIGLALLEFDQEFGRFPDETTAAEVKRITKTPLDLSGSSSNAMFRQLIAFGVVSEDIFYCKHPEGIRKPDKVITPGRALSPREVGFSYLVGLSTSNTPESPVLAAPMKIGTETFWDKDFAGRAVILRVDNSAESLVIRPSDGQVTSGGGVTLFDPAAAHWPTGYTIDLRHPEK